MPTDYYCEACNLAVQVGWFHYHYVREGCWAATLGYCKKCGTIHKLEHCSKDASGGKDLDRLVAQAGPLGIIESEMKNVPYRIPTADWIEVPKNGCCNHCGAVDQLQFESGLAVDSCPRCGLKQVKKLYSWMT